MTEAYNFERDLLDKCHSHRLSRIVRVLDAGTLPSTAGDPASVVQYLIFELADGDIRSFIQIANDLDVAWALRMMHHVTAALRQLHSAGIAHQDVKPSNILIFQRRRSKLARPRSRFDRFRQSPFDHLPCAVTRPMPHRNCYTVKYPMIGLPAVWLVICTSWAALWCSFVQGCP